MLFRSDKFKLKIKKIYSKKSRGRPSVSGFEFTFSKEKYQNGTNWREGNGRPKGSGTKENQVKEWRKNNPDGKKAQCIRDTGLSKMTVYKWWNQ